MSKKHLLLIILFLLPICYTYGQISKKEKQATRDVIQRVFPELSSKLNISSIQKKNNCDVFEQTIINDKLHISGSSGVAVARGVYDFIRNNNLGISSWTGNRLELPMSLDACKTRDVTSPFEHHYYFNVVTYGYTLAYWDWKRWEQEIDWMALHGIDMPLALVANEAISARVWKKLGLTDAEIAEYFVGPTHLPWMRMGNISGIDGPLPAEWHTDQITLQHKILKRMKSLGMKPICPGFAGFVPQAMKRLYPNIEIVETSWGGAFHNWMLSPEEDLFHTIGKMFIAEWEKEFGKNDYYIVDSFNEMEIPFPPKDDPKRYSLLASYGESVYNSIKASNKDAVWVMQGWMFGYQRHIWDYKTLQALVSKVPNDKMLLLDLAVDYNTCFWKTDLNWEYYKGFFNKPWVYSVIPNMGGKSGLTGVLEFYANGQLEALRSSNKGNLVGFGMAPEGIENNEVLYELITDAGWLNQEIDINKWLEDYSISRYGRYTSGLDAFWKGMLASVYGSFTDHPRYNWQLRPGYLRKGSINANADFYAGIEALVADADKYKDSPLFDLDFREWVVAYLGGKAEILTQQIEEAYLLRDIPRVELLESQFTTLMLGMDELLVNHPTKDLKHWLDYSTNKSNHDLDLQSYYEKNARRIVTIWGPPVDDYSARIWSGLIRDYYLPRWQFYFEQKKSGKTFDFAEWERDWVENKRGVSASIPSQDLLRRGKDLLAEASKITEKQGYDSEVIGSWNSSNLSTDAVNLDIMVSVQKLKDSKGISITQRTENGQVQLDSIILIADGQRYTLLDKKKEIKSNFMMPLDLPTVFTGNNECRLEIVLKKDKEFNSLGEIKLMK